MSSTAQVPAQLSHCVSVGSPATNGDLTVRSLMLLCPPHEVCLQGQAIQPILAMGKKVFPIPSYVLSSSLFNFLLSNSSLLFLSHYCIPFSLIHSTHNLRRFTSLGFIFFLGRIYIVKKLFEGLLIFLPSRA